MKFSDMITPRDGRRERLLSALKTEFKVSDFDPEGLGITRDLAALAEGKTYAAPKRYPKRGEHPRVYFNASQMDGIISAMSNPECRYAVELLFKQANEDGDGKLGPRRTGVGKKGDHNYDYQILVNIQSKAFAYAVTKYDVYGLEAIYMIENYIKTLDIYWMYSDQCREFGLVMFTAACVYDWCYELLSEDDKFRITSGCEHLICRGDVAGGEHIGPSSWPCKMEMGFPPYKQRALTGHGAENQLQRDYLSFAIAIYDEYPEWYEFISGRFYQEYVPARSFYYTAGTFPQGTGGYNCGRFTADLYAAVLLWAATGENPYREEDMRRVVYGLIAPVTDVSERNIFPIGDFYTTSYPKMRVGTVPIISSYLFNDPTARAIAKGDGEFCEFGAGLDALTPATFLIYSSRGTKTAKDAYGSFPLINYNGGWYGQTVARRSFEKNSPVSLMKVQCRTTANHDHCAAGTFQIYYKGTLTGDMGDYTGVAYGMTHCVRFMRSTIAHNGLLIYNPALRDTEQVTDERGRVTNGQRYYYCGAQRRDFGEPESLEALLSDAYKTGEVLGHAECYGLDGKPIFAYISGDNTSAYNTESVDRVRRSMLTVFTDDESSPMLLFVCDRIDAKDKDFKKTFLLQNPTPNPPEIDENERKIVINNGKGKLTLTNILGCDKIEAIGGSDDTIEDEAFRRRNYTVNGEQLHFYKTNPGVTPADGDSWGRVELSTSGNISDSMLNVLQVSDIDVAPAAPAYIKGVWNDGTTLLEGALINGICALFGTKDDPVSVGFKIEIPSECDLYLCGLNGGKWRAKAKGFKADFDVLSDEGIARLHLTAGTYDFLPL